MKALFVLDSDGKRVCSKYFTNEYPTLKEQIAFEKNIFNKTYRANGTPLLLYWRSLQTKAEILLWENLITVYKSSMDVIFYVVGGGDENELILLSVLNSYTEAISKLMKYLLLLLFGINFFKSGRQKNNVGKFRLRRFGN